jgi:hypothetical protein
LIKNFKKTNSPKSLKLLLFGIELNNAFNLKFFNFNSSVLLNLLTDFSFKKQEALAFQKSTQEKLDYFLIKLY